MACVCKSEDEFKLRTGVLTQRDLLGLSLAHPTLEHSLKRLRQLREKDTMDWHDTIRSFERYILPLFISKEAIPDIQDLIANSRCTNSRVVGLPRLLLRMLLLLPFAGRGRPFPTPFPTFPSAA